MNRGGLKRVAKYRKMSMNIRYNKWFKKIAGEKFNNMKPIIPINLQNVLNSPFIEKNGGFFFEFTEEDGKFRDEITQTINEAEVNELFFSDYLDESAPKYFETGIAFAFELYKKLVFEIGKDVTVILSFDGNFITIRFHLNRPKESYLLGELDLYELNAILVIEGDS